MKSLHTWLTKIGYQCEFDQQYNQIKLTHFPRETIQVKQLNNNYVIDSQISRHIILVLLTLFLAIILSGNIFANALIGAFCLYCFIQVIWKIHITGIIQATIISLKDD